MALILNTIYVIFAFGFALPTVFFWVMIPLTLLTLIDQPMIIYWTKPVMLQSELLAVSFLNVVKYAPCIMLFNMTRVLRSNYGIYTPSAQVDYVNLRYESST